MYETKQVRNVPLCGKIKFAMKGKLYFVLEKSAPYVDKRNTGKVFIRLKLLDVKDHQLSSRTVEPSKLVYQQTPVEIQP